MEPHEIDHVIQTDAGDVRLIPINKNKVLIVAVDINKGLCLQGPEKTNEYVLPKVMYSRNKGEWRAYIVDCIKVPNNQKLTSQKWHKIILRFADTQFYSWIQHNDNVETFGSKAIIHQKASAVRRKYNSGADLF